MKHFSALNNFWTYSTTSTHFELVPRASRTGCALNKNEIGHSPRKPQKKKKKLFVRVYLPLMDYYLIWPHPPAKMPVIMTSYIVLIWFHTSFTYRSLFLSVHRWSKLFFVIACFSFKLVLRSHSVLLLPLVLVHGRILDYLLVRPQTCFEHSHLERLQSKSSLVSGNIWTYLFFDVWRKKWWWGKTQVMSGLEHQGSVILCKDLLMNWPLGLQHPVYKDGIFQDTECRRLLFAPCKGTPTVSHQLHFDC